MIIARRFTRDGADPSPGLCSPPRASRIVNPDGSVAFEMKDILVPSPGRRWPWTCWPRNTSRAGVPLQSDRVPEDGVPDWLQRNRPAKGSELGLGDRRPAGFPPLGRLLDLLLEGRILHFPTGRPRVPRRDRVHARGPAGRAEQPAVVQHRLHWAYGIEGPAQGHYYLDRRRNKSPATSAYERPALHACFIQSVNDDLVNDGGIMDLWVREARIFKYGSGTGSNFSPTPRRRRAAPAAGSPAG